MPDDYVPGPGSSVIIENNPAKTLVDTTSQIHHNDLFRVPAADALRLLIASVEMLVRITGDIPPTPPPTTHTNPQMSDMQAEKADIVRSHTAQTLVRMRQQSGAAAKGHSDTDLSARSVSPHNMSRLQAYSASMSAQLMAQQQSSICTSPHPTPSAPSSTEIIDGVKLRQSPLAAEPEPYIIIGADSQPVNLQHGAIARKFYSKKEPPVTISQYIWRLHRYCPMSTAVYLAASLYIHRLAVDERAIPVTKRNAHRLVLAGLRVAMKALEDNAYSHTRFAQVGGVSGLELARLEISFCFLAGFELAVGEEALRRHWQELNAGKAQQILKSLEIVPTLRLSRRPRDVSPATG